MKQKQVKILLGTVKMDFNRAISCHGFWICIIVLLCCTVPIAVRNVNNAELFSSIDIFYEAYITSDLVYLFALCPTFVFSTCFCEDYRSRQLGGIIIRSGKKNYCLSKFFVSIISCGLFTAIGVSILIVIINVIFGIPNNIDSIMIWKGMPFGDLVINKKFQLYFLVQVYIAFLSGAFYGVLGMVSSVFIPNRYIAYTAPIIVSYFLVAIYNIFYIPDMFRVDYIFTGMAFSDVNTGTAILWTTFAFIILMTLLWIAFVKKVNWRIRDV